MKTNIKTGIKVGDIMTRNFVSARPNIPVLKAVNLMVKNRIGSLILTENGNLRGFLTEKDIIWALSKQADLSDIEAGDICTRKIATIRPSADVYDAISLMKKKKFRRLPVVVKGRVIGILTLKEVLKIQPELFQIAQEGRAIREYEEKIKRIKRGEPFSEGICEQCDNFDIVYKVDDRFVCESCREAM